MSQDLKEKNLNLQLDRDTLAVCFIQLFSRGVAIRASVGCNLRNLLCEQVGMSPNYMEERLQTVFLDGQPVDDFDQAIVGDGSVIALSAAMPGLVGAVLRKGGPLAGLRKSITYRCEGKDPVDCMGRVTVKLFNMTTREVGPLLLEYGILLEGNDILAIVAERDAELRRGSKDIRLDDKTIGLDSLPDAIKRDDAIFLRASSV